MNKLAEEGKMNSFVTKMNLILDILQEQGNHQFSSVQFSSVQFSSVQFSSTIYKEDL